MASRMGWVWLLVAVSIVSLPAVSRAGTVQLPQTGLALCVDSQGAEIVCTGTGQDGEIKAGLAWPDPRFLDNGDGTITDQLTGLMWSKDAGTPTDGSCTGGAMSWQAALNYIACINGNNYLGHNDWRLPNVNEMESLAHIGVAKSSAWLNGQGFINAGATYWSSTTFTASTGYAWSLDFDGNRVSYSYKTNNIFAWPVRQ